MPPSPIYILGLGNLGKLLAHALRAQHPALPIALLFHRASLQREWSRAGQSIEIVRDGVSDRQRGFLYENVGDIGGGGSSCCSSSSSSSSTRKSQEIHELIVATKTHTTVEALRAIRGRLGPWSTLLFLQNGIGTMDQVTAALFPDTASRPRYLGGIVNHGVYATSTFGSVHAGVADAVIGTIASSESTAAPHDVTTSDMAQAIAACPILSTTLVSPAQLLATQLQKLAINAVINPLTVIFDCRNGELFTETRIIALAERLIVEISDVVRAVAICAQGPSVGADVVARLDRERLRAAVFDVGRRTADNISSMRQDRLAGRTTEIDYINGYVVARGVKYGVPCPLNARIVQLVKDMRQVPVGQIQDVFGI